MNSRRRPLVIGITGNIAAGKSTVMRLLADRGATTIDMDLVTRDALRSHGAGFGPVVERFGRGILDDAGEIDRARLGRMVFGDPENLRDLEQILHPIVGRIGRTLVEAADTDVVVIEAIKMLEGGRSRELCDQIWVVASDEAVQLERLRASRGMSEQDGRQRLASQSSQEWKIQQADRVIFNTGSIQDLERQVDELWLSVVKAESS